MKLISSKAEYIPQAVVPEGSPEGTSPTQESLLQGIYQQIELAGRTAYHSQDKITPTSAKAFVDRMIASHHGAALEHGTVYLSMPVHPTIPIENNAWAKKYKNIFANTEAIYYSSNGEKRAASTTNYRYIVEHNCLDDLQYLCSPTEFHEKRYTMRFTCSRAIANELVRHRTMSFLQESTRYINYSKERHGGGITYIKPVWCPDYDETDWDTFLYSLQKSEECYFKMLTEGFQPQQARDVLPNATKTELIMTGFSSDWRHVMDLRLFGKTGAPHPDMVDLMQKAQAAMQEAGIWDNIMKYPSKFD